MDQDSTSSPKDTGEEHARASPSPSPRKRRQWTARGSSHLRRLRRGFLLRPPYSPLSPPTLPSESGSIMPCPRIGEEDAKALSPPLSPSPRKRRRRTVRCAAPLRGLPRCRCHRRCHLLIPLLLPLIPPPTPSAQRCVLLRCLVG